MTNPLQHYLTIQNKKYTYTITPSTSETSLVECQGANLKQEFLNQDIPALLNDLPNLILAEKEYNKAQSEIIRFRVSAQDKKLIEAKAIQNGYTSVSQYLRSLALN